MRHLIASQVFLVMLLLGTAVSAQTWSSITPPSGGGGFLDIDFIDANNGALALTSGGDVAWTTNGGASWSKNADIAADMYSVDMVDASTIYAIGGGGDRLRTLNSGSTWDKTNILGAHFHAGIRFATPSVGWAAEHDGRLYKTTNSGTSWTLQTNLGIFGMFVKGYVASTTVAYWPMGTNKTIKKTADGTTWNTVYTAPSASIVCMTGIDANNVWAGLSDGTIVKTTDGGANWNSYSTGVNFQINAIDFVSANEGWLVGKGGRIFYTSNGGVSWTQQTSGTTNELYGISMISSNLGFACGGGQTLFKFTNCSAEINLQGGSPLTNIVDGDITPSTTEGTDFSNVGIGNTLARTFTIQNTGTSTLTISSITSSNGLFTITGAPTSVAAGSSTTFTVTFSPTATGVQNATININNSDCDEGVYDFAITGTGCILPSFTLCPSTQNANTDANSCSATVTYSATATATITYAFTGATTGSGNGTGSGSVFNKGTTTVTVTATNTCGSTTCTFSVIVIDDEPPSLTCAGPVTVNTAAGQCTATVTLTTPTVTDNCPGSNGLSFDGVNDEVTTPVSLAANANATIEAWINPSVTTNNMRIISNTSGPVSGVSLRFQGSKLQLWGSCGVWQDISNTIIPENQWTHIAVVMNGNQITGFINGVQGVTITCNTLIQNLGMGGSFFNNGPYYNGKMDEVRFWNVARTATQIASNMYASISAQPGLVGLYHLNQGIAGGMNTGLTTATDGSGNGNGGTLLNFGLNSSTSNWIDGYVGGVSYTNNAPATYPKSTTTVTWTATDASGNIATCNQTVTVVDNQAPTLASPGNQSLNVIAGSCASDYTVADPVTDNCTSATWGYTLTGATTGTASGIADGTGSGELSFNTGITTVTLSATDGTNAATTVSFTVTVTDNIAPTITCPANIAVNNDAGQCNAVVTYNVPVGSDNCSGATTARTGGLASGATYPLGVTTNTFTVTASNGQTSSCAFTVTVSDTELPAVTCPPNKSVLQVQGSCISVVTGIDAVYSDNCAGATLSYSSTGATFLSGPGQASGQTFNTGVTTVTYTATDAVAQGSTCSFTVTMAPCLQISGNIQWENNNAPVKSANVKLETLPGLSLVGTGSTDVNGNYTVVPGTSGDYRVRPQKNTGLLNGVTAADATRIQQHIVNNLPLTGPYKRIAADVNKSNSITTYDATLITQALVGNPAALAVFNTSWRFVPTSYTFPNPNVPWGFPEKVDFTGLTTSQTNVNFVGVKIGDVNGSSNPQLKPAPPVVWQVEDAVLEAGQPVTVRFAVDHFEDIAAYQFALGFDPAILRYNDMSTSDAIPMNAENIGAFEAETGELRLAWFTDRGRLVKSGTTVFTLHFTAQSSGVKLSDVLQLNDKALQGIAYNTALEERGVALVYRDAQTSGIIDPNQPTGLELLQNVPNPTIGQTTIGFVLPQSCEAQLRILDVNGRLVTSKTGVYPAGYQQETFDISGHSGILYYELTTPFGTLVKKMVVVAD